MGKQHNGQEKTPKINKKTILCWEANCINSIQFCSAAVKSSQLLLLGWWSQIQPSILDPTGLSSPSFLSQNSPSGAGDPKCNPSIPDPTPRFSPVLFGSRTSKLPTGASWVQMTHEGKVQHSKAKAVWKRGGTFWAVVTSSTDPWNSPCPAIRWKFLRIFPLDPTCIGFNPNGCFILLSPAFPLFHYFLHCNMKTSLNSTNLFN